MTDTALDIAAPPSVDRYLDYRRFVRDWMSARKTGQRAASFAWVARRAGCSPGHVKNVLDGRRKLQGDVLDGFCKALRLDSTEGEYFRALVDFNEAQAPTEAATAVARLASLQEQRGIQSLESVQLRYWSRWHYVAIREMAFCRGFRDDPDWIAEALRGRITPDEARNALDALIEVGLLVPQADGPPRPASEAPIIRTGFYKRPVLASRQRVDMMQQGVQALADADTFAHDCRSLLVALPASRKQSLRDIVQRFALSVAALMDLQSTSLSVTPGSNGRVVRASINLLPLTVPFVPTRAR